MPKISVIVPFFYRVKNFYEQLDSLVSQSLTDIEIICVLSGEHPELTDCNERDGRIKIISMEKGGYGEYANAGIDASSGEYIAIFEPGDYMKSEMLEELYKLAIAHRADVVKCDFYEPSENADLEETRVMTPTSKRYYGKPLNSAFSPAVFNSSSNIHTGIYRRAFLYENDIKFSTVDGKSHQDLGFFFQTVALATRIVFSENAYYHKKKKALRFIDERCYIDAIFEEYEFLRVFASRYARLRPELLEAYHRMKFLSYFDLYRSMASIYKRDFLIRFSREFLLSRDRSEFDANLLPSEEWAHLSAIIENPTEFYYSDNTEYLERQLVEITEKVNFIMARVKSNVPYRPREIRFLNKSALSSRDAKDRYIELLEKKTQDLGKELSELRRLPEYASICEEMQRQRGVFSRLLSSIRRDGILGVLKKLLEKIRA
jgi:glycosyltransferase involved in cell wall biosynthesis